MGEEFSGLVAMSVVGSVVGTVAWIFLIFLIARFVFDYVFLFARDYTPTGVVLVLVEAIYTVTDPPIRLLCRVIPSIRIGQFDFQLTVVFLILFIGINILISMARLYL